MPPRELTLRARYVFPVDGPPIPGGIVRVTGERISHVGPADRDPDIDLGNAAIVPGFVNAHTHLELSSLRAKGMGAGEFTDWLRRVIEARRGQSATEVAHAIGRGVDACLASGTTLVGDISTGGKSWQVLSRSGLRAVVFCELLGLGLSRAAETAKAAGQFLEWAGYCAGSRAGTTPEMHTAETPESLSQDPSPPAPLPADAERGEGYELTFDDGSCLESLPHTRPTPLGSKRTASLSPHAPYSTHPKLYDLAADWGRRTREVICTHLAETREELRLLEHRDGPLRRFLASLGAWDDNWNPVGASPLDYLTGTMTRHSDWLIAHGNYLTEDEIAMLAARPGSDSARRVVVYCPRTHNYFGHTRHPYPRMLEAGLTVCLGTDSLASVPTLSILDEMRFLHRRDDRLPGHVLLHMATLAGAFGLRREQHCGSLTPGKYADLAVVALPDRDEADPHRLLLQSDLPVTKTMINGRFVFHSGLLPFAVRGTDLP
ncbi:MAG: amidohydrolase family protein [Planctomycetes bacterium]|nr:amidohydrolase family protein [Planctomycetota bacterium]